ncbi:hypothetical protein AYO45_01780 [Gammaproteobacteria bacterium SCGC AG-212-F23]|nr:hypothetical protein AYO45_01780 [Gammaproteobacteria bacterium SCGC AG-212-F23]
MNSWEASQEGGKYMQEALNPYNSISSKIYYYGCALQSYDRAIRCCPTEYCDKAKNEYADSKARCERMIDELKHKESQEKTEALIKATELQNKLLAEQAAREKSTSSTVAAQISNEEVMTLRASLNEQSQKITNLHQTLVAERASREQQIKEIDQIKANQKQDHDNKINKLNTTLEEVKKSLRDEKELKLEKDKVIQARLKVEQNIRDQHEKEKRETAEKIENLTKHILTLQETLASEKQRTEKILLDKLKEESLVKEKILKEKTQREKDEKEKHDVQEKLNNLTKFLTQIQYSVSVNKSGKSPSPDSDTPHSVSDSQNVETHLLNAEAAPRTNMKFSTPISEELYIWMNSLRISGVDSNTMAEYKKMCSQWQKNGLLLAEDVTQFKNDFLYLQQQMFIVDKSINEVHQQFDNDDDSKAEREYIKQHPKLIRYQNKLQQELTKFIYVYFLSTTGVLQLTANKKGMVLDAIANMPLAGQFLKIFIKGLQFANDKYRFYEINRLTNLFKGPEMIERTCTRFARHMAVCKEDEIQQQITFVPSGIIQQARGFYDDVRDTLHEEWHGLKTSSSTGISLQAEEKLAMLDAAILLQKILSDHVKINIEKDLVEQFLVAVLQKPHYQYKTPPHIKAKTIFDAKNVVASNSTEIQAFTVKTAESLSPNVKKPSTLLADLHATFLQKGFDKKISGNSICCFVSEGTGQNRQSLNSRQHPIDKKRIDADRHHQSAVEATRKQLNKQINHPSTSNEIKLEQARIYFLLCAKERRYFSEQKYSPLFYFKIIFASHLSELFIRCYLINNPKMNYPNDGLALTSEEIKHFRKFVYYACPLSENMYKYFESLSAFVTRGIVVIFDEKLVNKNSYAEMNTNITILIPQFRAALLKAMTCISASDSHLFDSPFKCVFYLLNCLIDHISTNLLEKINTHKKAQDYLQSVEKELKVISWKVNKHDPKMFSAKQQSRVIDFHLSVKNGLSDKYQPIITQRKSLYYI